jgi:hypothetical protein
MKCDLDELIGAYHFLIGSELVIEGDQIWNFSGERN